MITSRIIHGNHERETRSGSEQKDVVNISGMSTSMRLYRIEGLWPHLIGGGEAIQTNFRKDPVFSIIVVEVTSRYLVAHTLLIQMSPKCISFFLKLCRIDNVIVMSRYAYIDNSVTIPNTHNKLLLIIDKLSDSYFLVYMTRPPDRPSGLRRLYHNAL
ncbi:hypothetical protein QYM36_008472 [Artemia franciscana]|uniref:Uncharacterized protein n=1 Tax=Artemia franciscana TaxID=6661 RepID=A0AA88LLK1_ARTSF|nr:hypothetical protein QYM36_008472 [Artemia franciscana]